MTFALFAFRIMARLETLQDSVEFQVQSIQSTFRQQLFTGDFDTGVTALIRTTGRTEALVPFGLGRGK